jgi:hypothetical protein
MLFCSVERLSYGISAGGIRTRDLRTTEAARRSIRSNRHLHHRQPMLSHRQMGTLGNGRYRLSVTATQTILTDSLRRGAWLPLAWAPPRCVRQRRDSNPLHHERSIRHLHHQRWLSRAQSYGCGKPKFFCGAGCAADCRLLGARSAIGVRLIASFPPAGPAHLGTRIAARAPGSGSPVPA